MILTASTVKDSLSNLEQFVARNLAGGVDHLVIFVDDGDTKLAARLNRHPHVTAVATGEEWWHGKRPLQLNARQRINANVAKVVLAPFAWAEWVFHIDADECLVLDRAALSSLSADVVGVRARPLEAVSQESWPKERVTHFKRLLAAHELESLHAAGVIDAPHNGSYFHGHVDGKSGIRPGLDRWLTLHAVHDVRQEPVSTHDGGAQLLHYESWSGEEFARKWTNILTSGGKVSFRPGREPVAAAVQEVIDAGSSPRKARARFLEIYRETTQDDFAALLEADVLEEIDPLTGGHRPELLGVERGAALGAVIASVQPANKWPFHTGRTARDQKRVLDAALARLGERDRSLADVAASAWALADDVLAAAAGSRAEQAAAAEDQGKA
ncbi:MAG: glycosyltransferase family 2 protein [Nocardioides sp.]